VVLAVELDIGVSGMASLLAFALFERRLRWEDMTTPESGIERSRKQSSNIPSCV